MKIAFLSHLASTAAPTGAERSLALLAGGLAGRGHRVSATAPGPWSLGAELAVAGIGVASIPVRACWLAQFGPQPLWRQMARAVRYALPDPGSHRLRAWLAATGPDVVHVNCLPHVRGAAAARSCGLPTVWHLREILPPGGRRSWFARRLKRDAAMIVAVSEAVATWLREEGLGDRVEVVHNGVETPESAVASETARTRLGLSPDAVVVGLFGQLVAHKGARDFVRAAHSAARVNPELHFLIAGRGPRFFVEGLRREISAGAGSGRIHLIPPHDDIWELMAAVDLVAVTTLWPDPLPRAVMEAMAAGRPVVAYDGGGVPEMVVHGETGLLCSPGDVDGLGRALVELVGNQSLRDRLGEAGRARARQFFGVKRHLDRMESVFQSAVSMRRP
jgi:glycosyltransferase involved in cell wall biosynthesis